jgi:hypothetical protein
MKCAIMQPSYLPWMGDFYMMDLVDKYVFLDNVKLSLSDWDVRNRIKGVNGEIMLTVPIMKSGCKSSLLIKDAVINNYERTRKKHLSTIRQSYSKSKYFNEVMDSINNIYHDGITNLNDLTQSAIKVFAVKIGIDVEFVSSRDLNTVEGVSDERLLSICNALGCETYISPVGSSKYMNKKNIGGAFKGSKVQLMYRYYNTREYTQLHGNFIGNLSIVDLLFNVGFKNAKNIIHSADIRLLTPSQVESIIM